MRKYKLTKTFVSSIISIIVIFTISIGLGWYMGLHWLIIPVIVLIVAWLIGLVIIHFKSRPIESKDKAIIRSTHKKIFAVNEEISVKLELSAPILKRTERFVDKDIVILLDCSASMGQGVGSPLQESIDAIRNFVTPFPTSYQVSLIKFNHEALTLCPLSDPRATIKALESVSSGGQTNIHLALDKAKEQIDYHSRKNIDKVVILLSDGFSQHKKALAVADEIKAEGTRIICIGIEGSVDSELLKKIATDDYYLSSQSEKLGQLFKKLYTYVSDSQAAICELREFPNTPEPFKWLESRIEEVDSLQPQIDDKYEDQYLWTLPAAKDISKKIVIEYRLIPQCYGWYSIANKTTAQWLHEIDGHITSRQHDKKGPYVIVLPRSLRPLDAIIPLFIVRLMNELCQIKQEQPHIDIEYKEPTLEFPPRLDISSQTINPLKVDSGLIIGIGKGGKEDRVEQTLLHTKAAFAERFSEENRVNFLSINGDNIYTNNNSQLDNYRISDEERITLDVDLRPYIQKYRYKENTPLRCWIPTQEWLTELEPLTAYENDRRKARLALLLAPEKLEQKIAEKIKQLSQRIAKVVIVIDISDIQASGLVAEVAHILASMGTKNRNFNITLVIIRPDTEYRDDPNLTGMIRELSRMLHRGGEGIYSDRGAEKGVSKYAFNLIEKIFIVDIHPAYPTSDQQNALERATAHFLWTYFTVPNTEFLDDKNRLNQSEPSYAIHLYDTYLLPQKSIWEAICIEVLYLFFNKKWKQYEKEENKNTQKVNHYRDIFWKHSSTLDYPHKVKLQQQFGQHVLEKTYSDIEVVGKSIRILFPSNKSIHVKSDLNILIQEVLNYLSHWSHHILQKEAPIYNLYILTQNLKLLKKDMRKIITDIEKYKDFADRVDDTISFMMTFINKLITIIDQFIREIEGWLIIFIGWKPEMSTKNNNTIQQAIYEKIDYLRKKRKNSILLTSYQDKINLLAEDWYKDRAKNIFKKQIQFKVDVGKVDMDKNKFNLSLNVFEDKLFDLKNDNLNKKVFDYLTSQLGDYKHEILIQLNASWIDLTRKNNNTSLSDTNLQTFGKLSENLYNIPNKIKNSDDEVFLNIFSYEQENLSRLMQVDQYNKGIYAWSEEFNAEKLSDKVKNTLQRYTTFQTDYDLVTYLKDPKLLYAIILALVENTIYIKKQQIYLKYQSEEYFIEQYDDSLRGSENFYKILDRLIIFKEQDNTPNIRENITCNLNREALCRAFSKHTLINSIENKTIVNQWQDIVSALYLEYKN